MRESKSTTNWRDGFEWKKKRLEEERDVQTRNNVRDDREQGRGKKSILSFHRKGREDEEGMKKTSNETIGK